MIVAVGGLGNEESARSDAADDDAGVAGLIRTATGVFDQRGHGSIAVLSSGPTEAALERSNEQLANTHARVKFALVKLGPVDTEEMLGRNAALMLSPHAAARGALKAIRQNKRMAHVRARWRRSWLS